MLKVFVHFLYLGLTLCDLYIYISIRLKIRPNNVRIRFLEPSNFCSSLDRIWTHTIDTLQHHSLSLTSSALDHSTTSTPYIYIVMGYNVILLLFIWNMQMQIYNFVVQLSTCHCCPHKILVQKLVCAFACDVQFGNNWSLTSRDDGHKTFEYDFCTQKSKTVQSEQSI